MGKPGNTAKLKKKIFCKFGIFPRQNRVPASTDFFQVNKNIQLVEHHQIVKLENFQIEPPLATKRFQWQNFGGSVVFYPWNDNLAQKEDISTCNRGNSTHKNSFTDGHSKNCVKLLLLNQFQAHLSPCNGFIPWRHHRHKALVQSSRTFAPRSKNRGYLSNSMYQLSILISKAPFPSRNIAKIFALLPNTPTTSSIRFSNETSKIISELGDFSTPTQGQLLDFSRNPTAISEAANNHRGLITVQSNGGTKGFIHGTLGEEFLPFSDAEGLLPPTQHPDELKFGVSNNSLPLNPSIQRHRSHEKLKLIFPLMYPRSHHRIPTISPTAENSHNPTHSQLTKFSPMQAITSEIANRSNGLIKDGQIPETSRNLIHGALVCEFLLFSPTNQPHVPRAHCQSQLRDGPFTSLSAPNYFSHSVDLVDREAIGSDTKTSLMDPRRHGLPERMPPWLWYSRMELLDNGPRVFTNRLTRQIEESILPYRKRRKDHYLGHYERQAHYLGHRRRHLSRSYTCSMSFRIASCPPNAHAIIRRRERERDFNRESRKDREGVRERGIVRLMRHLFAYHAHKLALARITAYTLAHTRILMTQLIALRVTRNTLHWHYRSPLGYALLYE